MPDSDDHLRRAVDDVLEPAWPGERRRAARRRHRSTLVRTIVGLLGFWGLGLAAALVTGRMLPWTFFVCIAGLTIGAGFHDARNPEHLRRDGSGSDRALPRAYRPCHDPHLGTRLVIPADRTAGDLLRDVPGPDPADRIG